jgi:hypothetical protein
MTDRPGLEVFKCLLPGNPALFRNFATRHNTYPDTLAQCAMDTLKRTRGSSPAAVPKAIESDA